jgi:hypothetical protein
MMGRNDDCAAERFSMLFELQRMQRRKAMQHVSTAQTGASHPLAHTLAADATKIWQETNVLYSFQMVSSDSDT